MVSKHDKDNFLFAGSQGDKFYILLQGEVGVLIPKSNDYNYREVREQIESTRVQLAER